MSMMRPKRDDRDTLSANSEEATKAALKEETVLTSFRVPAALHRELKILAAKEAKTVREIMTEALVSRLEAES